MDGSLPGSPIPGILQARTLEWLAISFSNAGKRKVKVKSLSHVWLLATPWTAAYQAPPSMGFSRQEYWSGVPLPSPIYQLGWPIEQSDWVNVPTLLLPIWIVTKHRVCILIGMMKVKVKVTQSCPALCDPMDYTVHGILQARILEGIAVPFSRGSSQPRDWTQVTWIADGFFTSWVTKETQEYWSG